MSRTSIGPGPGIGQAIKTLRERAGLGLRDAARQMGISASYLLKLEEGETANPGIGTLMAAADVLQVTVGELIGEQPSTNIARAAVEVELRAILRRIGREATAAATIHPTHTTAPGAQN